LNRKKELHMKIRNVVTAAMLSGALFAVPAIAQNPQGEFAALQGVEAQALSVEEMQAISGQLNAIDIAAALTTLAGKLDAFPRLQAATLRLAAYYSTNAVAINAFYAKLGILTPCQTCVP
jgi:hypothetical protein